MYDIKYYFSIKIIRQFTKGKKIFQKKRHDQKYII
jgi:hypothetical protein